MSVLSDIDIEAINWCIPAGNVLEAVDHLVKVAQVKKNKKPQTKEQSNKQTNG